MYVAETYCVFCEVRTDYCIFYLFVIYYYSLIRRNSGVKGLIVRSFKVTDLIGGGGGFFVPGGSI
jgi:hypothetical protein